VITHRPPRPPRQDGLTPAAAVLNERAVAALKQRATNVRARRRQQLVPASGVPENVYIVRSGLLVLQTLQRWQRRQLLTLFYPDDIFSPAFAPSLPGSALSAAAASEFWRLPARAFEELIGEHAEMTHYVCCRLADQHARAVLHTAIVGGLNSEERVVSFLMELALRLGSPSAAGISFAVPLSRTEIADYLALNADTLSRIMSRLKALGVVARMGRDRALVTDWDGLCALSPIASALASAHGTGAPKRGKVEAPPIHPARV
jgi:CRP/FNR family transcriptional regulator, anaerobic regulatory protein